MTAATLERKASWAACSPGNGGDGPDLDLRGHDFAARRRCLFDALRALGPGDELVVGTGAGELRWLRYEMEARLDRRFRWSTSAVNGRGRGMNTVVRPA